jgi:FkbM family methyltransferase
MQHYKVINDWAVTNQDVSVENTTKKLSLDTYQYEELELVYSKLSNFRTAIDAGAHIGLVSNQLSQKFNNVEAFEFNPNVRECLEINMSNKECNNVTIHACGLGKEEKLVSLNFKAKDTNDRRSFGVHVKETPGDNLIKPLDDFNFVDVDFIKIDTEGYEPLVVQGALNTIKKYKPVIMFENKGHTVRYGYNDNSVLEILEPIGYKILHKFTKDWIIGV